MIPHEPQPTSRSAEPLPAWTPDADPAPAAPPAPRRPLPRPEDVRRREILGLPIAMTDYAEAMDVMDGMVERRDPGYVCAVAVHAVMVAQRDAEMRAALRGATLTVPDGMPLVW